MRKRNAIPPTRKTLPPKVLHCSYCSFTAVRGPNELQLHLDAQHRGWVDSIIKKMDIHETE